jgi:hypothetical protein
LVGAANTSVFAHRNGAVIRQLVDSSNARNCARICFRYVDIDGNFGSLTLDISFDTVPPAFRGNYGLTTNHGYD